MQRQIAKHRLRALPVNCKVCNLQQPHFSMLLTPKNQPRCLKCSTQTAQSLREITQSCKQYYNTLISKLPIPDYKMARQCLETVNTLSQKTNTTLNLIRKQLDTFENDLREFFEQTIFICQGYIDKLKNIEDSGVNMWLKNPPKSIDQEKYIFNIQQKQVLACKIEYSLKELQVQLPNIDDIKKETLKTRTTLISKLVSITSATKVRGVLYLGTNDGRIIVHHPSNTLQINAHQSLIRALQHDGQFRLFSSSDDQVIKQWDIRQQQPKLKNVFGSLQGIKSSHRQLVLVDNGKALASSRGQFDQYKIRIWNLQTYQNNKTLEGHTGYLKGMLVTPNNRLISVAQDRFLKVWQLLHCKVIYQLYHHSRINYVFHNSSLGLICIVDQGNRISLIDDNELSICGGVWTGKKVQLARADSYIYIYTDRYLYIYSWELALKQKIELGLNYIPTNIIEMISKLVITDARGNLHEIFPQCLAN